MNLPESWVEVRLGQVLGRVTAKINPQSTTTSHFYIGLEHIESHTGRLLLDAQAVTDGADILSIKTAFKKGDLLYGKLRPNLNKVYLAAQDGICSTDIWVLRASSEILPEFAVQYLRSSAIYVRAAQLAAGANLPRVPAQAFDRIPLPLPTLPEQQRIVEGIAQAQSLGVGRPATQKTVELATREYYAEVFGDIFGIDKFGIDKRWPVAKLGALSDIVRGSSPRPQGDPRLFGGPVPRLMVSDLTRDGLWVNARVDSLTVEGAKSSRFMPSQSVVMAVSGSPGLTAILEHDACIHDGFVGLRDLAPTLTPEFVAYTLNLSRSRNDQQAVGAVFRNLTTDQVKAMAIPLPPLDLQQRFRRFLLEARSIQKNITHSVELLGQLVDAIRLEGFSGYLTDEWRNAHRSEIEHAQQLRDKGLGKATYRGSIQATETVLTAAETSSSRVARHWLTTELSTFQTEIWNMMRQEWRGSVIVDDPDIFNDFCTNPQTAWRIEHFNASPNRIRRVLEQLAALGLVAKVSLPRANSLTQETEYLTAFRPLRENENTRLADADTLRKISSIDKLGARFSLHVRLDYQLSEQAGAGGTFQVMSITDDTGEDRTRLVDQGTHYASLGALTTDIAKALGVTSDRVELQEVDG